MLCGDCRVPGSANPAPETVVLLGALLAGDWAVVETSEPRHRREASGMVAAYLQWHLERGLKSWRTWSAEDQEAITVTSAQMPGSPIARATATRWWPSTT